jgi:formyltetrahydrofolate deformylase
MEDQNYLLTLSCRNRPGIVAAVSKEIFVHGGNILEAHQFDDRDTGQFFTRIVFSVPPSITLPMMHRSFEAVASGYGMDWSIRPEGQARKVIILVSKFDHCLVDLLYRWRIGEIPMDIVGIVSNHPREVFANIDLGNIPFHHFPVTKDTKPQQEALIKQLVGGSGAELVILARYMQILSDDLATFLSGRCINIHHSFLPGFKGAKPYHQAHARGVKMIGATAHYVTTDLDEGPIIHQDVEAISHADSPEMLVRKGRDIERRVLATAVRYHLDGRSLLNGKKTVVFRD